MKNILTYILITFTTIVFSQKHDNSAKAEKEVISTETKNIIRKGNEFYNQGNYVAAQNEYKKAIALNPNYDKANYNYGNTQFLQNKIKEAKEQYELVSKTTKDHFIKADTQHNLGNVAMQEKKYNEAVKAYKEALRNNPKDDETRYNLALAQKLLKEQQKKDDKNKDKKDKKDQDKKDDKKDDKKEQNEDKKKDKDNNKDKKKGDDKDKKDKKDDGKGKNDKDKKEQEQPKPKPSKLSPEQVKQLLEAMNKEENKTQKKMNAKKARGRKIKQDKDW